MGTAFFSFGSQFFLGVLMSLCFGIRNSVQRLSKFCPRFEELLDEARMGTDIFLVKPVKPQTLVGILEEKLKRKESTVSTIKIILSKQKSSFTKRGRSSRCLQF